MFKMILQKELKNLAVLLLATFAVIACDTPSDTIKTWDNIYFTQDSYHFPNETIETSDGGFVTLGMDQPDFTEGDENYKLSVLAVYKTGAGKWIYTLPINNSFPLATSLKVFSDVSWVASVPQGSNEIVLTQLDDKGKAVTSTPMTSIDLDSFDNVDSDFVRIQITNEKGLIVSGNKENRNVVMCYDAAGVLLWENNAAVLENKELLFLRQSPLGDIFVAGAFQNPLNDNDTTCFVIQMDNTGTIQWEKYYNLAYDMFFRCLKETASGGLILSTEIKEGADSVRMYVIELSRTGSVLLEKPLDGYTSYYGPVVNKTKDQGNIYIAYPNDEYYPREIYLCKMDSAFNQVWKQLIQIGATYTYALITGAMQTADGGYLITGVKCFEDVESSSYGSHYWMAKLNEEGMLNP